MCYLDTKLLDDQHLQHLVWFWCIDIVFIWTHGEESLQNFLEELNGFNQCINFCCEYSV